MYSERFLGSWGETKKSSIILFFSHKIDSDIDRFNNPLCCASTKIKDFFVERKKQKKKNILIEKNRMNFEMSPITVDNSILDNDDDEDDDDEGASGGHTNVAYCHDENIDDRINTSIDFNNNSADKSNSIGNAVNSDDNFGGKKDSTDNELIDAKIDAEIASNDASKDPIHLYEVQTSWSVFRQMLIPFLIAGIGSMFAGIVLNSVTQWPVFKAVPQISIMVSAFLGLIGNIETTLASRLSTKANLGRLDDWNGIREIISANFMVIQCQSSTVGLFAALCSLAVSTIRKKTRDKINWDSILLLCSTSIVTSIISNTIIAFMIIMVVLLARRLRINPG